MTPERWKQIEDLYHRADALPAAERSAFLIATCPDEALRAEVLTLLATEDGFIDRVDIGAARRAAVASMAVSGRLLGQYQVEELLGAGGMGEVYRARDLMLNRDVAIKLLPPGFTADPDRLVRLEREAQVLAALNHPNICAIHGSVDVEGIKFLVLELVEGRTLADRLAEAKGRGMRPAGLSLSELQAIAQQIVAALEAAHDKDIIHRDLKPANVKITPDGVVKVLDFGLAKNIGPSAPLRDLTIPPSLEAGGWPPAVIGTAAYMSPEQARGLPVDQRTDIWSFGCVLYEMLTGRPAFPGETVSDTIVRILEREPEWSALPPDVPAALRRILVRCLAKDPKKRLRDIGDARIEIDAAGEVLPGGQDADVKPLPPRRSPWFVWVALAALATAVVIWEGVRDPPPNDPFAGARLTPITEWEGIESSADISPDGRSVTFLADRDGQFDLWWTQIGTGRFNKLTSAVGAPRRMPDDILKAFGFSAEGDVWASLRPGGLGPNALFALTGGSPRPILGVGSTALSWSADGERLAYLRILATRTGTQPAVWTGDVILVADRAGGDSREIVSAEPQVHNHNPVWSPDGKWIYFVRGIGQTDAMDSMDVWRIKSSGGTPEQVTHENGTVNFLAPLNSRTLLYVGRSEDFSGPWLWAVDLDRRNDRPRRLTVGVEEYTSVSASRDGRRVVATVANPSSSLWRVPLRAGGADEREAEPYTVPGDRAYAPRFGGSSVFYLASSGGSDGLWRLQDSQPLPIRRGSDGAILDAPAATRDGSSIAFVALRGGERRLTVMSSDGTSPRTIAGSLKTQGSVDWSPDGRWIVTGAAGDSAGHGAGLYKVPLDGGAPVPLVDGQAFDPIWSPDDHLIVYVDRMAGSVPLRAVRPDGTHVDIPQVAVRAGGYRFLPDGKRLVYLSYLQAQDFSLLDLDTGTTRPITRLENRGRLRWFDVTPDGQFLVFDRLRTNANVVLIELSKRP